MKCSMSAHFQDAATPIQKKNIPKFNVSAGKHCVYHAGAFDISRWIFNFHRFVDICHSHQIERWKLPIIWRYNVTSSLNVVHHILSSSFEAKKKIQGKSPVSAIVAIWARLRSVDVSFAVERFHKISSTPSWFWPRQNYIFLEPISKVFRTVPPTPTHTYLNIILCITTIVGTFLSILLKDCYAIVIIIDLTWKIP